MKSKQPLLPFKSLLRKELRPTSLMTKFHYEYASLEQREAIVQKILEFYERISQTGRGGQSDFISFIQKQ